jgi:hypothetical protein
MTIKHTVTLTRQLENEVTDLFGKSNFFRLNISQFGNKQVFEVTWGGLPLPTFPSRKAVHEWVMNQIQIKKASV